MSCRRRGNEILTFSPRAADEVLRPDVGEACGMGTWLQGAAQRVFGRAARGRRLESRYPDPDKAGTSVNDHDLQILAVDGEAFAGRWLGSALISLAVISAPKSCGSLLFASR